MLCQALVEDWRFTKFLFCLNAITLFDCSRNIRFMIACSVTAEWYFRSSLDRYVWIFGMLCAWVHPKVLVCNASLDPRQVHHPCPTGMPKVCRQSEAIGCIAAHSARMPQGKWPQHQCSLCWPAHLD